MQTLRWIAFNLLLAAIPVMIAFPLAALMDTYTVRKHKAPWIVWVVPLLVWFVFLPNTCYLLSEWRHFLFDERFTAMREGQGDDPFVMLAVARQGLFFLAYSAFGALCFALSIRPIHKVLLKAKVNTGLLAVPFFLLTSLGVYMGLIVRLNSWDIVKHPEQVVQTFIHAVTMPQLLETIVIFAGLLWILYMIIDMWIDGVRLRFTGKGA
jgi:uncharacterized membrane protein